MEIEQKWDLNLKLRYFADCNAWFQWNPVCVCVQAENIMLLELDMTPPNAASLDRSAEAELNQSQSADNSPSKERGVRKSRSWSVL